MARFQCAMCSYDGHAIWQGELVCPKCGGTTGVRAAIGMEEVTDRDDAFASAVAQLARGIGYEEED